jgi:hypothetical protein
VLAHVRHAGPDEDPRLFEVDLHVALPARIADTSSATTSASGSS